MVNQLLSLRVHIVPLGFEIDRVLLPLKKLKADKVWLIINPEIESSDAKYYYHAIKKQLKTLDIDCCEEKCDIYSLFELLNTYRIIIEKEHGNLIFINISTGTKIEAIAGMLASMIFREINGKIHPYYVQPQKYEIKPNEGDQLTTGLKNIISLPNYKIERPSGKLIKALTVLKQCGSISKKDLIQKYESNGLILIGTKIHHKDSAKHSQLNKNYIEPLKSWGFIEQLGKGKSGRIQISEDGENILRFLSE
jgi:hypothetical protein